MTPLKGLADQILVVGHVRFALAAGVELFSGQILLEELALQWVAGARVKRSDSPRFHRPVRRAHPRTIGSRLWASSERGALQCWTGSGRVPDGRAPTGTRRYAFRRGASQIGRRLEGAAHRCQGPTKGKQKYDLTTSSRLRASEGWSLNVIAGATGCPVTTRQSNEWPYEMRAHLARDHCERRPGAQVISAGSKALHVRFMYMSLVLSGHCRSRSEVGGTPGCGSPFSADDTLSMVPTAASTDLPCPSS